MSFEHVRFTLTLNAPAARTVFKDGDDGLRLRMADGEVLIRPVHHFRAHADAVQTKPRARGGLEIEIEGTQAADLLAALLRPGGRARPFFLLRPRDDGWIALEHYDRDGDPHRHLPHLRVWPPADEASSVAPPPLPHHPSLSYEDVVQHAAQVVSAWRDNRRKGRPPAEVEEAQRVLDGFVALVRRVRPHLLLEDFVDLAAVERAHLALGLLLKRANQHPSASTNNEESDS